MHGISIKPVDLAFSVNIMDEVNQEAEQLSVDGYQVVSGYRKTGSGFYGFETINPDQN